MRRLIEMSQEYLIVCDNKNCDFKITNKTKDPNECVKKYLNVSCPKCGKNILTEQDYLNSLVLLRMIDWINKWFSWITIFIPKKKITKATVNTHNKISIKVKKDEKENY